MCIPIDETATERSGEADSTRRSARDQAGRAGRTLSPCAKCRLFPMEWPESLGSNAAVSLSSQSRGLCGLRAEDIDPKNASGPALLVHFSRYPSLALARLVLALVLLPPSSCGCLLVAALPPPDVLTHRS